jgi:hypothetical protein
MTSKVIGSIVALLLACSAAAADIRRVVTALDGNDKAIVLFEAGSRSSPEAPPRPSYGSRTPRRRDSRSRTIAAPSRRRCRPTSAPRYSWSNFRRSIRPKKRKWIPTS